MKAQGTSRLILLGIDSLDLRLARRWAQSGAMPNFAKLLVQGAVVSLSEESTRPLPASVWTTLLTGVSPGTHGFVEATRYRKMQPVSAAFSPDRFYKTLSDQQIRCAVVDAPADYPLRPFNGVQIVDWGAEFWLWGFETEPRSWKRHLTSTYGQHPLTKNPPVKIDAAGLKRLRLDLDRGMRLKLDLSLDLLSEPYELLFLNFAELHKAGHYFWKFYDPTHPDYDASDPELANALESLHRQLDDALGELLTKINGTDNLIIISDRGMEHNHRAYHVLEETLVRLGLLRRRASTPGSRGTRGGHFRLLGKQGLRQFGRKLLPNGLRESLVPWYRWAIGEEAPTDAHVTRVFFEPGVGNSFVRVNLKGREPYGIVEPGAEYDILLAELERELYALLNPATGQGVIRKIYFPWRMYKGCKRDDLPDVSIVWNAAAKVDAVQSDTVGLIEKPWQDKRSGNHTTDAFLLCWGPGFAKGAADTEADARQLAPTVFHLLNRDPPQHYELGPLAEVLRPI